MEHGLKAAKAFNKLIKQTAPQGDKPGRNRALVAGRAGENPVLLVSPKKPSTALNELKTMSKKLGTFTPVVIGQVVYEGGKIVVKALKAANEPTLKKTFLGYYTAYKAQPLTKSIELLQPDAWEAVEFEEDPADSGEGDDEGDEHEGDDTAEGDEEVAEDGDEPGDGEEEGSDDPAGALTERLNQLTGDVKKIAALVAAHPELRPFVVTASTALNKARSQIGSAAFDDAETSLTAAHDAIRQAALAARGGQQSGETPVELTPEQQEQKHDLGERLKISIAAVHQLENAETKAGLAGQIKEIAALIQAGKLADAEALIGQLEDGVAGGAKEARRTEAEETSGHRVEYAKLMLRWRQAKGTAAESIAAFGRAVLTDPEVMTDDRYPEVQDRVAHFNELMPDFGTDLEDMLEELETLPAGEAPDQLHDVVYSLIDDCLQLLDEAEDLQEMGEIASSEFGTSLSAIDTLRTTLGEISDRLAA